MPFTCSICGEDSSRICARCTKDACNNHICERCLRCSDCCDCEVALAEPVHQPVRAYRSVASQREEEAPIPTPDPEPDEPDDPAPDPAPGEEPLLA